MKRFLLALILLFFPGAVWASCSGVTNTFVNGTIADAGQVNQNFSDVVGCINAITSGQINLQTIASLRLQATPAAGTLLCVQGYAAIGDAGGPWCYKPASPPAACSLNSGLGDGGSQIPLVDGNCALIVLPFTGASPRQWGAKGDGSTDDTAAVQSAASALITAKVPMVLDKMFKVGAITTTAGPIEIIGLDKNGYRNGQQNDTLTCNSGFVAKSTNISTLISIGGYTTLRDFCIKNAAAGLNSSGSAISNESVCDSSATCPNGAYDTIDNVLIDGPCIGIAMSGSYITLRNNFITNLAFTGCGGIRIGAYTNSNRGVQPYLNNNTVFGAYGASPPADYGVWLQDVGGPLLTNNAIQTTKVGLLVKPGLDLAVSGGQSIQAINSTANYWGDTTTSYGIQIDTVGGSFGVINGQNFIGDWVASSSGGAGVHIANTGGGGTVVNGIYFDHLRSFNNAGNAFEITSSSVTDVSLTNSCLAATVVTSLDAVSLASGVGHVRIIGNSFGVCGDVSGTWPIGIHLGGSNADLTIADNDFSGTTTTIDALVSGPGSSLIKNNRGIDDSTQTVSSATTITLNYSPTVLVNGTTTVNTITGNNNQQYTLVCPSTVSFSSGGNFANTATCTGAGLIATFIGSTWYLK